VTLRDYLVRVSFADVGQRHVFTVCAANKDLAEAAAKARLPEHRHHQISGYEYVTITDCAHSKGVV